MTRPNNRTASFPSGGTGTPSGSWCPLEHHQGGSHPSGRRTSGPPRLLGGQGRDMRDVQISGAIFGICLVLAVLIGLGLMIWDLLTAE